MSPFLQIQLPDRQTSIDREEPRLFNGGVLS
jgi:hypothetical protein